VNGLRQNTPLLLALCFGACGAAGATERDSRLFDGVSLAGWHVQMIADNGTRIDAASLFRPEHGVIHVYPDAADGSAQPHAILVSDRVYTDYRVHVEYRWGRNIFAARLGQPRDAGVLIHITDDPPGLVKTWYRWPKSLEYQIMEGDTGSAYVLKARAVGSVDPATGRYRPVASGGVAKPVRLLGDDRTSFKLTRSEQARERPGWNSVDIEVRGDRAVFFLNGREVNVVGDLVDDRAGPPAPMREGRIALQAEGAEVFYRNVRLVPLKPR